MTSSPPPWPSLRWEGSWPASQAYVHRVTQMLGKLRLALSPSQPQWMHAALALGARGLTTGPMPTPDGSIEAVLDVHDAALRLLASDGTSRTIPLLPARSVAEIWSELTATLVALGVDAVMWDKPQEMSDTTPLSSDHRARTYDPASVRSWFAAMTAVGNVFEAWRSGFFGRSGLQFWWGAFDLSVVVFSGRRATPREGAGLIGRHDLDAEHVSLGFWPGDERTDAMFYGYIVPEPAGCAAHPLGVPEAGWVAAMGEWVLPYEVARTAAAPADLLHAFMDAVYAAAGSLAGWDLESLRHEPPPRRSGPPSGMRT